MAGQYEVSPQKNGAWKCEFRDGKIKNSVGTYDSRAEAYAAAKEARGDGTVELFLEDGTPFGSQEVKGHQPIYLFRLDGSLVGELDYTGPAPEEAN